MNELYDHWPSLLLSGLALLFTAVNVAWTWFQFQSAKSAGDGSRKTAFDVATKAMDTLSGRVDAMDARVAAYRLEMAQKYVTNDTLDRTEGRLLAAVEGVTSAVRGLGDRIDRAIDVARYPQGH